jgi:VanZ family protein
MPIQRNARLFLAGFYFLFISVLFLLPGSALPKNDWLDKIWFDKWVHIGLFLGLAVTWSWAIEISQHKHLRILFLLLVFYGIMVEIVQHNFVANRSFDVGDWIADMVGGLLGLWFWYRRYTKK